ncbi:hypothetical protein D6D05_08170 [Aureobasidium pullulans]|nr:hypothetical protein D6D05_08170 [Aureobasidium pullulans]
MVTKGFQQFRRAEQRHKNISFHHNLFPITQITYTMAPKRAQSQGAISQMYTSLASPDNRSVVTAVAFFAVSSFRLSAV